MNNRFRRARRLLPLAVLPMITLAACGGDSGDSGSADDCETGQVDGDLYLYNWSEYIDPELKDAFAAEYGVEVIEDNYDSNEAMQPIVAAGNSGYDVIVPSDYMVSIMIEEGSLMPLNLDAIPNMSNLATEFYPPPYDSDGAYVAPYQWGTTGLGIDLTVMGEDTPRTWGLIFDPELSANFDGRITLLNDPRETLGAALKYLGYSLNTTSADELAEAKALVADAVDRIAAFDSDQYDELLASGETAVAHGYSGNMLFAILELDNAEDYTYFVPEEGGTIWTDNMAVPFDAPHPCTAHSFINFILDAENGAALTNWNLYASPNAAAEAFIDAEVLEDEIIYPSDRSKLEFITDTGDFETEFSDALSEAKG
ncbi:MAG: polyamine ABC transporter substrate-binding protein [Ilumatobacteraceae bacterium]|jgi:spermidine/putrescine-binding protein